MEEKMPSKGAYLAMVIIGFLLGVIWGALSLGPYQKLKGAVAQGDAAEANRNAKKIRTFFIIAIVVNGLMFIGRMAGG